MFTLKVSGDADGGWHVEIHDGTVFNTYNPMSKDAVSAARAALTAYVKDPTTGPDTETPSS